jgi:hypothetical protein
MTTASAPDVAPKTAFFRLLYVFDAVVGMSILTLTLTYILQVYNSLQRRNTFAMKMHAASDDTADAAPLLAALGSDGTFKNGYTHLTEIAAEMLSLAESHHFYPVLFYFRFREPPYALSRMALLVLDTDTLIKSALDDERYGWLKESAAVAQLWRSTMRMVTLLAWTFLPDGLPGANDPEPASQANFDRWRERYFAACSRLREAGIRTMPDERAGAEIYVNLRVRWDRYIAVLGDHMAQAPDVVDPAGKSPERIADETRLDRRLHTVS